MKNMKLGSKIIGMTVIIVSLMLIFSAFGIFRFFQIRKQFEIIAEFHIPLSEMLAEVNNMQLEQTHWLERVMRYGEVYHGSDKSKEKDYDSAVSRFRENTGLILEELKKGKSLAVMGIQAASGENERRGFELIDKNIEIIETGYQEYIKSVSPLFDMIREGKLAGAEKYSLEIEKKETDLHKEIRYILDHIEKFSLESAGGAEKEGESTFIWMSALMIVSAVFALILSMVMTRWITGSLDRIIEGLAEGSDQIVAAAEQSSSASQSLAEGASRQAASVQETSSALEQLSSMTMQNAANAKQAAVLRKESLQSMDTANNAMQEAIEAMNRIKSSGEEIGKIIKSIDEIAFQTNLLALNAAVEAARAGESGAGFAVVAGEVRNLAMRSAEASRDTQTLIHRNVEEISAGAQLVEKTRNAFTISIGHNEKVGKLVEEISAASAEQSEGIGQIRRAVAEIESVTHQNAANAQQSASSSEELNAQAEHLKAMANELLCISRGKNAEDEQIRKRRNISEAVRKTADSDVSAKAGSPSASAPSSQKPAKRGAEAVKPEQMIPLDDDNFSDF
ncbi:MAG: methyl-accepting chemotaxis protein [Desulfococcaceae bacterium]